jgi:hypothetical protein
LYRLSHPLGEWVIEQGKEAATTEIELVFDYSAHPTKLSVIESLVGQSGFLTLSLLSVESVQCEQYLIFSALNDDGVAIDEETCRKLFHATNPEDQLRLQNELSDAERNQRQLRKGLFEAHDEIEEKRDDLIDKLELRMRQTINTQHLFSLRWSVI